MSQQISNDDRLLPFDEVRARLGHISRASLYRLISDGRLQVFKLGRRSLVRQSDLQRFIAVAGRARQ